MILKIAWRNLFRHRGQSLVVGAILFLGALLMTLGNGVVTGMDRGLHETVVHGFTGDLVLVPEKQADDNVFMEMMGRAVEPLYGFPAIAKVLGENPRVESFLPVGKNMAMLLNEDGGMSTLHYLLGVDFERYRRMFPHTLNLLEGRLPEPGRPGLLLPAGARKEIYDQTNIWFLPKGASLDTAHLEGDAKDHPGDLSLKSSMVMLGFNQDNSTTDIRVDVDGVFRYRSLNTIFGSFILVDIESYRQCLGYFQASERTRGKVSEADSALLALEEGGLDDLFGAEEMIEKRPALPPLVIPGKAPASAGAPARPEDTPAHPADLSTLPEDIPETPRPADLDQGAYNLVLVLLKPDADAEAIRRDLNDRFRRDSLGVRAITWKAALGVVGSMASLFRGALFLFVSFLFLVAVIIIINTLSMAALERMPEIGMMRAIGARKSYISRMFLAETSALSLFFGGLGILAGALAVQVISLFRLTSENDMLQIFFGGDVFQPRLSPADFVLCLLQLALVSVAAVLYPLLLARSITPRDAVYKE